ncbi:MAG: translocation/assembly module TamB domain-containing protein [bacterium]
MKNVLRRGARLVTWLLLGFAGLLALLAVLLGNDAFLTWLAPRVLPLVGFELHVGLLAHDLGRRIEIRDATFGTPGEEPWIRVSRLALEYRVSSVAPLAVRVRSLTIEQPRVRLGLADDGTFQWPPTPGKGAPSPVEPEIPEPPIPPGEDHLIPPLPLRIEVGEVHLADGYFELADHGGGDDLEVEGISLEAGGVVEPSDLHAKLGIVEARYGRGQVGPIAIDVALDGDVLRVARVDVATPEGGVHVLEGTFEPLTLATHAKVHLDRVRLEPIVMAFADVPELPGPLTGDLTLDGVVPDAVSIGIASLSGAYLGQDLGLEGQASGSFTDYEKLAVKGHFGDLAFDAAGRFDAIGSNTDVRVSASAPTLALADALAGGIGLTGAGLTLDARASGAFDALRLQAKAGIAEAELHGARLAKLAVDGGLDGDAVEARLAFDDLAAPGVSLGGGWLTAGGTLGKLDVALGVGSAIEAKGTFDTDSLRVDAAGTIRKLDLEPFLALVGARDADGSIEDASFRARGLVTDLTKLDGAATVNGLRVSAHGAALIQTTPFEIELAGGRANGHGSLALVPLTPAGQPAAGLDDRTIAARAIVGLKDHTLDANVEGKLALGEVVSVARPFVPMLAQGSGSLEVRASFQGPLRDPATKAFVSGRDLAVRLVPGASAAPVAAAAADASSPAAAPAPAPGNAIDVNLRVLDFGAAGDLTKLYGTLWIDGGEATAYGRRLWDMSGLVKLDGGDVWVNDVRMAADGIWLVAYGSVEHDGRLGLNLRSEGGRVEAMSDLTKQDLSGALDIQVASSGTLRAPVAKAHISATDLYFRERAIGDLVAEAEADGQHATLSVKLPGDGVVTAETGLAAGSRFSAQARVRRLPLDPGLKGFQDVLPPPFRDASGYLAFDADLAGPLDDPAALSGTVVLNAFEIAGADAKLALAAPCTARVDGSTLDLDRARLVLGDGFVEVGGRVSPARQEIDVALELDPKLADGVAKGVEIGSGRIVLRDGRIVRAGDDLNVHGVLTAGVDSVTIRGIPDAMRDVSVEARFDGRPWSLSRAFFRMGDGDLTASASGSLEDVSIAESEIDFHALPYRMPKTVRAAASGRLAVAGDRNDLRVTGKVRIDEALYERDVEVLQNVIKPIATPGRKTRTSASELPAILDAIHLDVAVTSGEDLLVRNNVARLAATADLNVKGTAARPQVLGQVRVGEGTVKLFGRSFALDTGTIDFSNPLAIDPDVHIVTRSTIDRDSGSVDVLISLDGTVSKGFALVLSSSPEYPQDDIVFLLATGKTRAELQSGGTGGTSITGPALMAVSLLGGDKVKEALGLEELGLEESATGGARVSVAKRLGDRMTVRAINEIGGKGKAPLAVAVEYQLLDRVLLVATPQSNGAFGAEVRFRFLFR